MSDKVKVLVVDDSFLMRRIISDIVNSDPHLEVVGKAKDGDEALEKIAGIIGLYDAEETARNVYWKPDINSADPGY